MKFLKIEIEEFGKLQDMLFLPGEGLNLFEGANESGKSTVLAFLRFLLYGFPRKGAGDGEEREKRLSWRTHRAAGSAVIRTEAGEFCITRQVTRQGSSAREGYSEHLSVTALDTGEAVALGELTPGEYFLGLPAALYDSTMCLRQSDAERVSDPAVGDAVSEMLFTGSGGTGAEDAMDALRRARKELQHQRGRGGRIAELEDRVAAGEETLARAREDAVALAELRAKAASYREHVSNRRRELEEISGRFEEAAARQTLSLFDQANAAARVQEQKLLNYEALRTQYMQEYGNTAQGVTEVRDALHAYEALSPELLRLRGEVERMRALRHDENMLDAHAIVEEQGGTEAVLADFHKAARARTRYRKAAWICFAICLALAAVTALVATGVLTPLLTLFMPVGDYLPGLVVIGAGLTLFSLAVTLVLWGLKHGHAKRVRGWMKRLHVAKEPMFRTYLEQCAVEAETAAAHRELLGELTGTLAAKESAAQDVRARLAEGLAMCALPVPQDPTQIPIQIAELEERRRAAESALAAAHLEYERAGAAKEALMRPLAGKDEAALRAKVSAGIAPLEDEETLRRKQAFLRESLAGLERKLAEAERGESALAATAKDVACEEAALAHSREELTRAKHRLSALALALEAMEEATRALRDGLAPKLCQAASAHFAALTDGKYTTLHTGTDLSILLDSDRGPLPLSHFSAGCRDAAHLSLRLALLETLCEARPPLLFDEAFARLDDERTRALLKLLVRYGEAGGQVLLFSCHSREATFLADEAFTHFELQ